ncbi:MAG: molybdopterin biosynthesis protein [Treponema sp.]|nr:molybdopterin biosynthesis protein [Treponema sp.]
MANRNLYLSNTPVEEALSKYLAALEGLLNPKFEEIPAQESLDRITSEAVYARFSSPLFNAAAMDGITVKASAAAGARESNPLVLKETEDFIYVNTGDKLNHPYDAVIMAEDLIQADGERSVKIIESPSAWQHVRPIGEDIVAGEMIIPGRHKIRPVDIGVLFSGGITSVNVYSRPRVAIIPTGNEIIDISHLQNGEAPEEGRIIESNARMFEAQVKRAGAEGLRFDIVPDSYELLKSAVLKAADDFDMVLINAGSSAGTEDFTVQALRETGDVIVHGVAMKPGKPVILAVVNNKPVIGTPGYPVSAYLSFETFASPVLSVLTGSKEKAMQKTEAVISRRIVSSLKHREYVRVKTGRVDGRLVASPLARGAGAAMSLVRADGFCVIDQQSEGIEAGETAKIELCHSIEEIDRTLVAVGSHDLILDMISDMMSCKYGINLASTHAGSMAGLTALKRGECHIAPVHLLDEDTGGYNKGWIKKILPDKDISLIKGVGRVQGLIVKKNNPLGIKSIADICRCRFINRQRGAGTRLFLDHLLKGEGINPGSIDGYTREGVTHMAVAAAVHGGSADAGLGITSAAKALDLDFIPMGEEEYDFALFSNLLKSEMINIFIDVLKSPGFHQKLDGYTWAYAGEIVSL